MDQDKLIWLYKDPCRECLFSKKINQTNLWLFHLHPCYPSFHLLLWLLLPHFWMWLVHLDFGPMSTPLFFQSPRLLCPHYSKSWILRAWGSEGLPGTFRKGAGLGWLEGPWEEVEDEVVDTESGPCLVGSGMRRLSGGDQKLLQSLLSQWDLTMRTWGY